jgi:hypothetical protein
MAKAGQGAPQTPPGGEHPHPTAENASFTGGSTGQQPTQGDDNIVDADVEIIEDDKK